MRILTRRVRGGTVLSCVVGLFIHFFLSPIAALAQSGVTITPLNQTLRVRPGARQTVEFSFINESSRPAVIDINLQSLAQDRTGAPLLGNTEEMKNPPANWMNVQKGIRTVAPGQRETIRVNVSVPRDLVGSAHGALVVRLLGSERPDRDKTSSARMVSQTILPIHIFAIGTEKPSVILEDAQLVPAPGNIFALGIPEETLKNYWVLKPRVKNTGNSMVRLRGDIVITSRNGQLVGRYQVADSDRDGQAILPNATVVFPILIASNLPEERYPARINLRFAGPRRTEGYSAPMTLVPRAQGVEAQTVSLGIGDRTGLQALIEPSVVIGTVAPGGLRTQRIVVSNLENFPVSVQAAASSLSIDTDGEPIAVDDGSVSSWMNVSPPMFRLGAQQSRIVSVRMNASQEGNDRWGILQFSMASAAPAQSTLTTKARTVVLLRNAAKALNTDAELKLAQLKKVALTRTSEGMVLSLTLTNTSTRPLAFAASALSLNIIETTLAATTAKDVISKTTPKPVSVSGESNIIFLPGATRRLDFTLPDSMAAQVYNGSLLLTPVSELAAKSALTPVAQFALDLTGKQKPTTKVAPADGKAKPSSDSRQPTLPKKN